MADENNSNLLAYSAQFRTSNLVKNVCGYVDGKEYNSTSKDVMSDGDCRGRDPIGDSGTIGTNIDINMRNCLIVKNSCGYTPSNEYNITNKDVMSDGDCRGRDPQGSSGIIGTNIDINMRNCLIAKNGCGYTPSNEYTIGNKDVMSDGDCRGRDPQGDSGTIGTSIDINARTKELSKNAGRYVSARPYGEGNC